MGKVLTKLSFEEWVRYLFDHPVNGTQEPAWYWNQDADSVELPPQLVIAYSTRLFLNAGKLLAPYTDAQANQGLWLLIGEGTSPLYALCDASVALKERLNCVHSIVPLFENCFVPRCTQHLSHFNQTETGTGALNAVCYMWWDTFPLVGEPEDMMKREIDEACLSVMETILQLPSLACQESALHGLGHWGLSYKNRCQGIISAFLKTYPDLKPELAEYASHAHEREVQ